MDFYINVQPLTIFPIEIITSLSLLLMAYQNKEKGIESLGPRTRSWHFQSGKVLHDVTTEVYGSTLPLRYIEQVWLTYVVNKMQPTCCSCSLELDTAKNRHYKRKRFK